MEISCLFHDTNFLGDDFKKIRNNPYKRSSNDTTTNTWEVVDPEMSSLRNEHLAILNKHPI